MSSSRIPAGVRSLADATAGERLLIHSFLFDAAQRDCSRQGIEESALVQCHWRGDGGLFLETEAGRRALVPWERARFIRVERVG